MSSLRFASFGAATMPLSKIIVDRTLDMGDYPLIGQRIMAPYRPYTWETEPVPYNDTTPRTVVEGINTVFTTETLVATWTCDASTSRYVRAILPTYAARYSVKSARIAINGVTVYTMAGWAEGTTKITDAIPVKPGDVFELYATSTNNSVGSSFTNGSIVDTGYEAPVNLDLKGRFLALEQDFGELTATLTFGDEENVPFSDYPNRFPYAPDKITLSMHTPENRPVIKVYKGV